MRKTVVWAGLITAALGSCENVGTSKTGPGDGGLATEKAAPPRAAERAPDPSARLPPPPRLADIATSIETFFQDQGTRRLYIQTDKPVYQPGETIWIKSWDLLVRNERGGPSPAITYQLVNPKGAAVQRKRVQQHDGQATNDLVIPPEAEGGEYQLRAQTDDGRSESRPVVVSRYEAPRIKKTLEFTRKAYGPGDRVEATVTVKRPTGEPLARKTLTAVIQLDGQALPNVNFDTSATGAALLAFPLPARIERGDGLVTVLVEDGGITESIGKSIPIVLARVQLSLFPEGGELVEGLPGRLYFEARTPLGKPADVEGQIVDDQGQVAGRLRTYHFGLGRTELVPSPGRRYHVEITRPTGITAQFPLPAAREDGCVLRVYDDYDGQLPALRVAVRCSTARTVLVSAVMRENHLDAAAVKVAAGVPAVVYLRPKTEALARAPGVARVTVFDQDDNPLAERLVFRNRRRGLQIQVTPDHKEYGPRDRVALAVRTTDGDGRPVPADLALSVVDDTVVSFADDKTGHLQSRLLLEQEIADKVEEPKFFFDLKEDKAAEALDLLMGTRGYRRFGWRPVLSYRRMPASAEGPGVLARLASRVALGGRAPRSVAVMAPAAPAVALAPPPAAAPEAAPPPPRADKRAAHKPKEAPAKAEQERDVVFEVAPKERAEAKPAREANVQMARRRFAANDEMLEAEPVAVAFAPVRLFPAPSHRGSFSGVRSDFRETVHWAPRVRTDGGGRATVTFFLSDAITSFRVFAEGAGGGLVGHAEEVFKSSLPFSMSVKLPVEVSAGDRILVPLTLTNERPDRLPLRLRAAFGAPLHLEDQVGIPADGLAAGSRQSLFYPVTVGRQAGESRVSFAADAGGLGDELVRQVRVAPLGFPQTISRSGSVEGRETLAFDTGAALPGTVTAKLIVYPSPTATLLTGLEQMVQEPGGCFEQTSSSNYPNVMVLDYLKSRNDADPELVGRVSGMLERGYRKLAGFETQQKGYEWFGQAPAHEALTAYGVLEFADMKRVWGGVDGPMLGRTVAYLRAQRDGAGGFVRSARALDTFGRAKPEVTDAYIVYALTEAGVTDLGPEIDRQRRVAASTEDPYLLALATSALLNTHHADGQKAARRLAGLQAKDGHFAGRDHSITRSTGQNLDVETTALATLALMKAGSAHAGAVRSGVEWLIRSRGGAGSWGATQATVLALKALTAYTMASKQMTGSGSIELLINGRTVGRQSYQAGRSEALVFDGFGKMLTAGANKVQVVHQGERALPYSLAVDYRSTRPASHPDTAVALETRIARSDLKMGDAVRVTVTLRNRTTQGQPMTLARIGLPGGLAFQSWQLKELVDKKVVDFYETRGREVILYLRQMAPGESRAVPLDLVATVPGDYTGPASQAYLYYTDDQRAWVAPLAVHITR